MTDEPTVVLIHGLWLTPRSWEHWITHYEAKGERVLAPAWPGMEGEVEALRADPSVMNGLGVVEIADHYERIIRAFDNPPVIMGHSFGGLITQILIDRGLGTAGVALHAAPAKGLLRLPIASLRAAFPVLRNPAHRKGTVLLTPKQFHYSFTNEFGTVESQALYDRYHVAGPGRPLWQAALANFNPNAATKVDFGNDERPPLLLIAGGRDHTVPASINRECYRKYGKSKATTEFREFAGRCHFTMGQPGWEEVADYALQWARSHRAQP